MKLNEVASSSLSYCLLFFFILRAPHKQISIGDRGTLEVLISKRRDVTSEAQLYHSDNQLAGGDSPSVFKECI